MKLTLKLLIKNIPTRKGAYLFLHYSICLSHAPCKAVTYARKISINLLLFFLVLLLFITIGNE